MMDVHGLVTGALAIVAVLLYTLIRRIHHMAISLDLLTSQVSALESAAAAACISKVGSGASDPGVTQDQVDAVTARVKAVTDNLNAAVTPPST